MALTIALALVFGLIAQVISQHLRMPSIVLLLAAGVLIGPDGLNLIQPDTLGAVLQAIVGYAVAIVLFEGGMNLNAKRLLKESKTIQKLITIGAFITAFGGALAAHFLMHWSWEISILFGTLVIVTGPTVIGPLLRRIKVNQNIHTILEAEGVLIDPIGAIIAIVALEIVIHPSGGAFATGILDVLLMLGTGALLGLAGGYLIALLMKPKNLIPEGLENIFVLAIVLALFHVCNEIQPESGIASVTVAGVVVGNIKTRALRDLMDFKEQLTVMLIALLFVLLAADVRLSEISELGTPGLWTVALLIFLVRPLNIFVSTIHSNLSFSERAYLSWIAPRGIVAAAVASFAAITLNNAGIEGGDKLRALVFLVIAVTVVLQGLSGGLVAQLLKVRRPTNKGYAMLGANEFARLLGRILRDRGEPVLLLDSNPEAVRDAEHDGFKVIFGNGLEERTMQRASLGDYATCIGFTTNEEVNLLFINRVRQEFKTPKLYLSLHEKESSVSDKMLKQIHAHMLFGQKCDIGLWSIRMRRGLISLENWVMTESKKNDDEKEAVSEFPTNLLVPMAHIRNEKIGLVNEEITYKEDDIVVFSIFNEQLQDAINWLNENSWQRVGIIDTSDKTTVGASQTG